MNEILPPPNDLDALMEHHLFDLDDTYHFIATMGYPSTSEDREVEKANNIAEIAKLVSQGVQGFSVDSPQLPPLIKQLSTRMDERLYHALYTACEKLGCADRLPVVSIDQEQTGITQQVLNLLGNSENSAGSIL